MSNFYARNECEACQLRPRAEDEVVVYLRERVSALEDENQSLRKLGETVQRNSYIFHILLRASEEGVLLVNPELRVLRLVHSTLGYAEKDLLGASLDAIVHPDDVERVRDCCSRLMSSARNSALELRALTPDGRWIWLRADLTGMLDDPNIQAIVLKMRRIDKPSEPVLPAAL